MHSEALQFLVQTYCLSQGNPIWVLAEIRDHAGRQKGLCEYSNVHPTMEYSAFLEKNETALLGSNLQNSLSVCTEVCVPYTAFCLVR